MKTSLFTFLFLIIATISMAQTAILNEFDDLWRNYKFVEFKDAIAQGTKVSYDGTPYLEFKTNSSTLILNNDQTIDSLTIRYNIYHDQMEIERGGIYYVIPRQKELSSFQLADHLFKYMIFSENNTVKTGNLEVLSAGKCSLFKQHHIFLAPAQGQRPYQDPKLAKFKSKTPVFFVGVDEKIPIRMDNIKDFIALLPDHQDNVTKYIKKNKIKFRKQEDIIQVTEYYNSL